MHSVISTLRLDLQVVVESGSLQGRRLPLMLLELELKWMLEQVGLMLLLELRRLLLCQELALHWTSGLVALWQMHLWLSSLSSPACHLGAAPLLSESLSP